MTVETSKGLPNNKLSSFDKFLDMYAIVETGKFKVVEMGPDTLQMNKTQMIMMKARMTINGTFQI